jgi:hypothetical protein
MPSLIITLLWVVTVTLVVQYGINHPDFPAYEVILPWVLPTN